MIEQPQGGCSKYTSAQNCHKYRPGNCIWSDITTNTHPAIEFPSPGFQLLIEHEQICHCQEVTSYFRLTIHNLKSKWPKLQGRGRKVILGKDKQHVRFDVATGVWRPAVGNWGKFLSLSLLHYVITPPFNLTLRSASIHWALPLRHMTRLNLARIAKYLELRYTWLRAVHEKVAGSNRIQYLPLISPQRRSRCTITFTICHFLQVLPLTLTALATSNFTHRCSLFSHLFGHFLFSYNSFSRETFIGLPLICHCF